MVQTKDRCLNIFSECFHFQISEVFCLEEDIRRRDVYLQLGNFLTFTSVAFG